MPASALGESLQEFAFETPTADAQGVFVAYSPCRARFLTEPLAQSVTLEMVYIPGGTFLMGSPLGQGYDDERPQHTVTLGPFLLGKYPVTQEQWQALMGPTTGRFRGPRLPVSNVSWHDANAFCRRLAARTRRPYALPSEAQWEYACRANTATPFAFGETLTTDLANYNGLFTYLQEPPGLYRHEITPVGSFAPNAFGLYDLHGQLWEWCADTWHPDYAGAPVDGSAWTIGGHPAQRVARGGSWHDGPDVCRSAVRLKALAAAGDELMGFRVMLPMAE